jgi:hypothetical protein
MIQSPIAQITALCTLATTMAMAESGPRLVVTQLPADASSAPMLTQEGSEPLPLMLRLEFACGEQEELTALFVAAADTAVGATSARSPQDVLLKIPAGQLQAVRETAHCPAAGPLLLRAPLTACRWISGLIARRPTTPSAPAPTVCSTDNV